MKKADRQLIFDKYCGHCAYYGCELSKGWHVDEIEPCRRVYRWEGGYYHNPVPHGSEEEISAAGGMKWIPGRNVLVGYSHPERLHIDNQTPACASCNINKHFMSLEEFRAAIAGYMTHLNEISTQYKIAKRYGLIQEKGNEVVFYFEK